MTNEVSTEEAARLLKCSPRTIRYMIWRKTIKSARIIKIDPNVTKGVYRIQKAEIENLVSHKK